MKLVIAPDSFKESLSAPEVAAAIARGWSRARPLDEILLRPMADGGEGTVDAVLAATGGERRECAVRGPLGASVQAHWGWLEEGAAVIEMAAASGLHWVAPQQRDATRTTSYGTGELIRAALDAGARKIILGLGGSATNDGGMGLLQALGVRFLDERGEPLGDGGAALAGLHAIDLAGLDPRLAGVEVEVAADVNNPLCGEHGASAVFGPQKGASPEQVRQLDAALARYAEVAARTLGQDHSLFPGVGAAGGLGFAARAFLRARFRPGVELVAEVSGLAEALQGADLAITGEGRLDEQSLHGKTPIGVARLAREAGVPLIALAGSLGKGYGRLHEAGIAAAFSLVPGPISLAEAMAGAAGELEARAEELARLWSLAQPAR
ncbi:MULTISPECIES: glycerate kinase [unclassified Pseudomonas]|uniref:glycerate kinase n=1 Tax=unclassified Pseudomonas TaxID=196821 RepID=UPI0002A42839|nr:MULTISPECIES: glycerate kinase [unclassified Pseudomonas]MBB1607482.1 glycerate kinase [Pseudomonas sp. UMC76]MBB1641675.1 glycerate kinase [Pseudomonas sp. UME83]NTX87704.1 glycerate kinase [Pseudomonas sp. UMA643]NTY22438.1 glycerate kinase [Pseudomonas sp. UMC3103]NTY23448.1 glycerate kinase [Pseudomonas sp. UMA603]